MSASLLKLLLGPRVSLRPTALAMSNGSARADTSSSISSVAKQKQKQAALESVLNELGQSGALKHLRAFDASIGGAAVSFEWADQFTRHLKHASPTAADSMSAQPKENLKWSKAKLNYQHHTTDSRKATEMSIYSGTELIEEGVTRLPAALLGDWSLVEHIGFEVGEFHR